MHTTYTLPSLKPQPPRKGRKPRRGRFLWVFLGFNKPKSGVGKVLKFVADGRLRSLELRGFGPTRSRPSRSIPPARRGHSLPPSKTLSAPWFAGSSLGSMSSSRTMSRLARMETPCYRQFGSRRPRLWRRMASSTALELAKGPGRSGELSRARISSRR